MDTLVQEALFETATAINRIHGLTSALWDYIMRLPTQEQDAEVRLLYRKAFDAVSDIRPQMACLNFARERRSEQSPSMVQMLQNTLSLSLAIKDGLEKVNENTTIKDLGIDGVGKNEKLSLEVLEWYVHRVCEVEDSIEYLFRLLGAQQRRMGSATRVQLLNEALGRASKASGESDDSMPRNRPPRNRQRRSGQWIPPTMDKQLDLYRGLKQIPVATNAFRGYFKSFKASKTTTKEQEDRLESTRRMAWQQLCKELREFCRQFAQSDYLKPQDIASLRKNVNDDSAAVNLTQSQHLNNMKGIFSDLVTMLQNKVEQTRSEGEIFNTIATHLKEADVKSEEE